MMKTATMLVGLVLAAAVITPPAPIAIRPARNAPASKKFSGVKVSPIGARSSWTTKPGKWKAPSPPKPAKATT